MSDNSADQPPDNAYSPPTNPYSPQGPVGGYSPPPADSAQPGEQQSYTYPPPPPPNQTWPPPPGGVYQAPMPVYPTPTNAVLILIIGIISIIAAWGSCGIGGLIGILPWVMGNTSLKAINQGLANPMERSMVNGGRICGIVGSVLGALILLFYGGFMAFSIVSGIRSGH